MEDTLKFRDTSTSVNRLGCWDLKWCWFKNRSQDHPSFRGLRSTKKGRETFAEEDGSRIVSGVGTISHVFPSASEDSIGPNRPQGPGSLADLKLSP
ncbi:hypothetical protein E4U59_000566, partial [Claviceps monticola]